DLEQPLPNSVGFTSECLLRIGVGDVLSDRMTLEPVDPAFSLLQIHRAPGQAPMDDGMPVEVETESLLPYRGRGEDERPERRVERMADMVHPHFVLLVRAPTTEPDGEPPAHRLAFDDDRAGLGLRNVHSI